MSALWTSGALQLGSVATLFSSFTADGTVITAHATAHTKGSWTEVDASLAFDVTSFKVGGDNTGVSATDSSQLLDIGIGTSGNEKVLVANIPTGYGAVAGALHAHFPIFIPAGTRVSARLQSVITVDIHELVIYLFGGRSWAGETFQVVDTIGALTASSHGTDLSGGGIVEMVASTAFDYKSLGVVFDGGGGILGSGARDVEIFVGAASSEKSLITKIDFGTKSSERLDWVVPFHGFIPLTFNIPAGTRLSMQGAGSRDIGAVLFGYR